MLHAWQAPSQAVLQHTPPAQWADAHSLSALQTAPFILGPHSPFTHFRPVTQSASLEHALKHSRLAASHENGAQTVVAPSLHSLAPSQV
jgi:hypothetical protein